MRRSGGESFVTFVIGTIDFDIMAKCQMSCLEFFKDKQ